MAQLLKSLFAALFAFVLASPIEPLSASAPVTAIEWKAMLARTRSGGVIDLGSRKVAFQREVFQPSAPVTIRGGVFNAVVLDQWHNVTFDGATFVGPPGTPTDEFLLVADEPRNLTIRNSRFTGYATEDGQLHVRGPSIREGRNVTIERSTFETMAGFINFVRTDGGKFLDNDLKTIREGLDLVGGRNITVERNRFEDFRPFGGDHADGVQFFTTGLTRPTDTGTQDVVIRHNLILAGGRSQGIFSGDELNLADVGRGYERFTIEENIVVGAGWHGITTDRVKDFTIRNNRLFRIAGVDTMDSRIAVAGGSGVVTGNEANAFIYKVKVDESGNRQVRESSAARIETVIAEWMARFRKS